MQTKVTSDARTFLSLLPEDEVDSYKLSGVNRAAEFKEIKKAYV